MRNNDTNTKLILLSFLIFTSVSTHAGITGRVVSIIDGDTITVLDNSNIQYKVRLAGIDAPEKKQPFGQNSKQSLSSCAYNKITTIEGDKKDRYGRLIGKVMIGNHDCNLRQVQKGLAWHYKKYMKEQIQDDRLIYMHAEEEARSKKLGLWVDKKPIPPWEWRKR